MEVLKGKTVQSIPGRYHSFLPDVCLCSYERK